MGNFLFLAADVKRKQHKQTHSSIYKENNTSTTSETRCEKQQTQKLLKTKNAQLEQILVFLAQNPAQVINTQVINTQGYCVYCMARFLFITALTKSLAAIRAPNYTQDIRKLLHMNYDLNMLCW